jgi:hypothetical protein
MRQLYSKKAKNLDSRKARKEVGALLSSKP